MVAVRRLCVVEVGMRGWRCCALGSMVGVGCVFWFHDWDIGLFGLVCCVMVLGSGDLFGLVCWHAARRAGG